jgi:hypothetical protein
VHATREGAAPHQRAALEALDTSICISLGRMAEALACGRRAAAPLDVALPTDHGELGR